jgi:hypothetical protein
LLIFALADRPSDELKLRNLTPELLLDNGRATMGASGARLKLHQKFDRSYKLKAGPLSPAM